VNAVGYTVKPRDRPAVCNGNKVFSRLEIFANSAYFGDFYKY